MAGLLCGAVGAATLGLSGCGNAADSGRMDAANANAVAGGSSDLPVITWKMGSTWGDGNIHFTCCLLYTSIISLADRGVQYAMLDCGYVDAVAAHEEAIRQYMKRCV